MLKLKSLFHVPILTGALLLGAVSAQAGMVFQDDFNTEHGGTGVLNYTAFSKWSVSDGTVDLIGNGYFDFYSGNGLYVDLDGSTSNAGVLQTNFTFSAGTYDLSFYLGGSTRNDSNAVTVTLGSWSQIFTLNSSSPLALETITLTTNIAGTLSFSNAGGDNVGAILDNVTVSTAQQPVPEPATMLLFGTGLIGFASIFRRKNT